MAIIKAQNTEDLSTIPDKFLEDAVNNLDLKVRLCPEAGPRMDALESLRQLYLHELDERRRRRSLSEIGVAFRS